MAQPFQHVECNEPSPSVLVSVCTTCFATECEAVHLTAPASQRYFEFAFTTRHSRNASQTRFEQPAPYYPLRERCTDVPQSPKHTVTISQMLVKPSHCSAACRVVEEFQNVVRQQTCRGGTFIQLSLENRLLSIQMEEL